MFSPAIRKYLNEKYEGWKNLTTRATLFGTLPAAYNTNCPPIPWFGSLDKNILVVSLEPLLTDNFEYQVNISLLLNRRGKIFI